MNYEYSKKVMQHFKNPKNMGEVKDADGIGEVGNPHCGDVMHVSIKVAKNKEGKLYLKDVRFKTLGCIVAIATSSMITELAKGNTLEKAKKITNKDVATALGNLPPIKMHCSNLAADALHKAIENFEKKKN